MTLPLILALGWCLAANLIAMLPSRDHHWRAAYALMALGAPILIGLFLQNGWPVAMAFVLAAGSILRWPVWFVLRWVRRIALSRRDGHLCPSDEVTHGPFPRDPSPRARHADR